jgi:hypothetical protein
MEAKEMVAAEKAAEDEREVKVAAEKSVASAKQRETIEATTKEIEEEKWTRDKEALNNNTSPMDTNIP